MTEVDPGPSPEVAITFADLAVPVRQRLVSWVAAGLPDIAVLPPPLRRVRDFAPPRRARAGAASIGAALDEEDFRGRAAAVVPPDTGEDDPAARAARAWLVRADGWPVALGEALALLGAAEELMDVDSERVARLEQRLAAAEVAVREDRARHRQEVQDLRAENARLRRSLGEERRAAQRSGDDVRSEVVQAQQAQRAAELSAAAREREVRHLQARLDRAEADAGGERRAVRTARDDASARARLLLDTVLDAADGLRRELALPPASSTPGERVERDLASEGVRDPSDAGGLGPDSPTLLGHYLAMPRARLVVDGYNVTRSVWETQPLEAQRARLLRLIAPLVARTGAETTVVFDAHQVGSRPVAAGPRGVRVVFSPEGVIADDVIRDLVAAEPQGRVVVVVTGDLELAGDVRRAGARVCGAPSLLGLLG